MCVRRGITDYGLIGEIDMQALRQYRSQAKPFKSVQVVLCDFDRKVLAAGEKE